MNELQKVALNTRYTRLKQRIARCNESIIELEAQAKESKITLQEYSDDDMDLLRIGIPRKRPVPGGK